MATIDPTKIIQNEILAAFMEDNQEATGEEARQFVTVHGEKIVEAFVQAVAEAKALHISTPKVIELVTAIFADTEK
jgi:DNA-binding transcriptional regulator YhcF (GntR family)